jgi:hypothetical protein
MPLKKKLPNVKDQMDLSLIENNVFHVETDTIQLGFNNNPYFIRSDDSGVLKFFNGAPNAENIVKVDNGIFQTERIFMDGFTGNGNILTSGQFGEILESNIRTSLLVTHEGRIHLLERPKEINTDHLTVQTISGRYDNTIYIKSNIEIPTMSTNSIHSLASSNLITVHGDISCRNLYSDFVYSDKRLKTNIRPLEKTESRRILSQLRAVKFDHADGLEYDVPGLIAQEVQSIDPSLVGTRPDGYLFVRYDKLIPHIINAMDV